MKRVIKRLTNCRYLRIIFKKLWNAIRIYLTITFKNLLDNIGKSPLKWLSCITILLSFFIFPDFVNVSPKNHLQIMGRYVDVVS